MGGGYDIVITSPEMVLDSNSWRQLISDKLLQELWGLVTMDETHCISQWGFPWHGKQAFRAAWGQIGVVRALLPADVPFLATSATLPPQYLDELRNSLLMPTDVTVTTLGNDRLNIFMKARTMKHDISSMKDFIKSMVFFNNRGSAHKAHKLIQ
jgi:superfamily II DNA helicase RecQ